MRRGGRGFKGPGRRHRWERPWLRWPAQGTGAAPRVLASAAGQQGECRMKARIVLALVAGWMALAASPLPAQSRAVPPTVSAQARAAVAEVGHLRVMVALRPRVAFSRARLSQIKALRMVQVRSEEHTSYIQSLMRISYAVFLLQVIRHNNFIVMHHHKQR